MTIPIFVVMGLVVLLTLDAACRSLKSQRKTETPAHRYSGALQLLFILGFGGLAVEHSPLGYSVPYEGVRMGIGVPVVVLGVFLVIWARVVLGHYWSPHVYRVDKQRMIRHGPYAIMRHPVYVGEAIVAVGLTIYFGSISLFISTFIVAGIYNCYRASKE